MADRNDFQDRVNAYRAERGRQAQTPGSASGGFAFSQGPILSVPPRRVVPGLGLMVRLSRIGVGLVPVLFGLYLLKSIYPNAFGFEVLDGLVNGTRNRAETYLPGEVDGWVRIAPSDADRDREKAFAGLADRFPGGIEALHRDPAIGMIRHFLDTHAHRHSLLNPKSPTKRASALYLGPEGQLFSATLVFLAENQALGPQGAHDLWLAEL